jgi:DNA-binding NtrC family response regulator
VNEPTITVPKRLLIIDDDPKIIGLLMDVFHDRFDMESAQTGEDGLAAARRQRPDLVILDFSMPGQSGLDVLKELKRTDPTIPVVMITASSANAVAEEALKNGAFAYLPKPFQIQYAEHLVAAALALKPGR